MRNISLSVDAGYLDVDGVVDLDLINPLFHDLGSHTLPFTIPLTKNNRDKLGIDHSTYVYNVSLSLNAVLKVFSKKIFGTILIESTSSINELNASFITGRGTFFNKVKNKYITEIEYSDLVSSGDISGSAFQTAALDTIKNPYPSNNYVFSPIYMPNLPEDESFVDDEWKIVNDFVPVIPARFESNTESGVHTSHYSPMFYLHFVFKKILETEGYSIETDDFYEDEELRTLVIFSGNYFTYDTNFGYATFRDYLPNVLISDLITWFEKRFNFKFIFNEGSRTVSIFKIDNVIENDQYFDINSKWGTINDISHANYDGFKLSNSNDSDESYLSDNTSSFERDINNSNLDYIYEFASALTTGTVGEIAYIQSENKFYVYDFDIDTTSYKWMEYGSGFIDYESRGSKMYELVSEISTLLMDDPGFRVNYLPRADYERNYSYLKVKADAKRLSKLCLLFYRGLVPINNLDVYGELAALDAEQRTQYWYVIDDDTTYKYNDVTDEWEAIALNNWEDGWTVNYYPLLSPGRHYKTKSGYIERIPGLQYTLSYFGDGGLYDSFFEKTIYWIINLRKTVKSTVNLNINEIDNINWQSKYRSTNQNYFFSKIPLSIDFGNQTVSIGECELFTV